MASRLSSPGGVHESDPTTSEKLIARSTRATKLLIMRSWGSTRTRRITAGSGCDAAADPGHLFPRRVARSVSAHHPDVYRRMAPRAPTGPACFRDDLRGLGSSHAPSFSRAPICASRDQSGLRNQASFRDAVLSAYGGRCASASCTERRTMMWRSFATKMASSST